MDQFKNVSEPDTPLEVYLREQDVQKVVTLNTPDNKKEEKVAPKKDVKFKANQAQRTDLEDTWAPTPKSNNSSSFLSNQGVKQQKVVLKRKAKKAGGDTARPRENGDYQAADSNRRPLQLPGFGDTSGRPQVPSYIQAQMPDGIRLGNVTALNADQYKYYSFSKRMAERFIPKWGNKVRRALYQWLQNNNFPPVSKTWVTQLEVIMDEKGEIIDVQPFRLSGFWDIDRAGIDSFKIVGNVPNPPAEMVDENGYIHLQYQLEVHYIPQPGIRFQGGGPGQRSN